MIEIATLRAYCDGLLRAAEWADYCPNGLQVEGDRPVRRLMTGVTACQALVDAAVAWKADALLVHHGYFWKGEAAPLVGIKGRRVRTLMRAGLSLFAYHLPLDVHPELGNNRRLGAQLGVLAPQPLAGGDDLLWCGRMPTPCAGAALGRSIAVVLGRVPVHVAGHARAIETLAWCTGAAQGRIEQAALAGADAFLSGEISEQTAHLARELGIDYFAAGHHATERYGVQALGAHLAERFGLVHHYVDIDNPA
ncbi:Nif3-like dinuclear metal center hexameric protein [Thiococcus pfennigii]|uniref:Nif3-like dinuclear metal center hexameric protein n=1 Tax=Thiococcus pfennigii TaxID=1057 RepID=UPI0019088597|nr:Nif3-like dinuclear metal center hexameric protein [Thiococcus pfennigii]MBK1732595.1 Nif3-like dinuclear metal center hexameric protein [Thiococcus pfennigii]